MHNDQAENASELVSKVVQGPYEMRGAVVSIPKPKRVLPESTANRVRKIKAQDARKRLETRRKIGRYIICKGV